MDFQLPETQTTILRNRDDIYAVNARLDDMINDRSLTHEHRMWLIEIQRAVSVQSAVVRYFEGRLESQIQMHEIQLQLAKLQ